MKKIIKLFMPLLLLFSLVGCGKYSGKKIMVETEENIQTAKNIDATELAEKRDAEENFVLYIYRDGCSACEAFKPKLEEFIYLYQVVIYSIDVGENENYNYLIDNVEGLKYTPTLVIYSKGDQFKKADPSTRRTAFSTSDGLAEYLFTYIDIE